MKQKKSFINFSKNKLYLPHALRPTTKKMRRRKVYEEL